MYKPEIFDEDGEHGPEVGVGVSDESTPEVCIVELGGTVGDIESYAFIEALRQLKMRVGEKTHDDRRRLRDEPERRGQNKARAGLVAKSEGSGISYDMIVCRSRKRSPQTQEKDRAVLRGRARHLDPGLQRDALGNSI